MNVKLSTCASKGSLLFIPSALDDSDLGAQQAKSTSPASNGVTEMSLLKEDFKQASTLSESPAKVVSGNHECILRDQASKARSAKTAVPFPLNAQEVDPETALHSNQNLQNSNCSSSNGNLEQTRGSA